MTFIPLTPKQQKFFSVLQKYMEKHDEAPTIEELMKLTKISSPRGVVQYLEALEKKGLILRAKGESRGIRMLEIEGDGGPKVEIPVFSSAGCDNVETMAERVFDEFVCVGKELLHGKDQKQVVGIKASGNSMDEAGIMNGDYVLVEVTENIQENDLVVAIIDNFAVIKKLEFANNAVILKPVSSDPSNKPIILHRDFKIFGKVLDVLRAPQKGEVEIIPLYSK
jgi:repressor LexA